MVEDDELADILLELAQEADDELFWFDDGNDGLQRATADDVNRFIVEHAGPAFSARDFRTWGGSCVAFEGACQRRATAGCRRRGGRRTRQHSAPSPAIPTSTRRSLSAEQDDIEEVWGSLEVVEVARPVRKRRRQALERS